ncbi:MAG: nitrous oxide reductase family maturation protein NosD [Chitinophagaceae bacterium]|nr:nitrous oxide reductase family maturation protein NosD [Chitinophagaceae bacterium]
MKKTGLLIWISILVQMNARARIIDVGPNRACSSVTAAVKMALDGDTVRVYAGRYFEKNLVIGKRIVLIGINHPVLDGEKKYEVISIKANGVVVDGFHIQHSGVSSIEDFGGIKIYQCRDVIIRNNILDDTFFGIYCQQATNCTIRNNRVTAYSDEEQQSGNGIHCWKSDSLLIIGNTITGHRDGIYFEFVTHSIIWRNTSYKNLRYGLHFMFSQEDTYVANIFRGNGAGVAVMYSHGVKMYGNFFEQNWGDAAYGLLIKELSDSYIEGNYFNKNTTGIHLEGATRISMKRNQFEDNGWGMKIQASCMDINVTMNNFTGNTFDVGTNGSLMLNSFDKNYWDKYDGYDLNRDKIGDIPYRPVSLYSMIVEKNPPAMILFRSFISALMDKTEKIIPSITPENMKDEHPMMKKYK